LVVVVGVVAGPLFDMGYLVPLMVLGSGMIIFGMMRLSLSKEYWQILLAQGLCVGLGAGFVYIPALAIVATQFTTKRPIAIGIASAGSSIGGIIFSIMFRRLQPRVGFGWAVRSIAFINLGLSAIALAILSRHRPPKPAAKRTLFDLAAWKEPAFALFALALLFLFLAFYMPLFYVPSFALYNLHKGEDFAFDMLTVTNAGSFLGRTLPFLMGNRIKPMQNLFFWTCAAIVLLFSWMGIHNTGGFVVWCAIYGFVSGVLVTGPAAAVVHPVLSPSMAVIGTRLGMSWATAAIGILIGTPIAGALVDVRTSDFVHGEVFAGAVMAAGVVCLIHPLVKVTKYKAQEK
jgi:predicted MFS family arabinose efflux permease